MKAFGTKYPILFEILLFIAAMLLSIAFGLPGMILYFPVEISNAIGRILCGIVLFFVFRYCFAENRPGAGIPFAAFGLILVLWNLLNSLVFTAGAQMNDIVRAVLLGLAPAVWEEIIFRGIFIYNLEKSGK